MRVWDTFASKGYDGLAAARIGSCATIATTAQAEAECGKRCAAETQCNGFWVSDPVAPSPAVKCCLLRTNTLELSDSGALLDDRNTTAWQQNQGSFYAMGARQPGRFGGPVMGAADGAELANDVDGVCVLRHVATKECDLQKLMVNGPWSGQAAHFQRTVPAHRARRVPL